MVTPKIDSQWAVSLIRLTVLRLTASELFPSSVLLFGFPRGFGFSEGLVASLCYCKEDRGAGRRAWATGLMPLRSWKTVLATTTPALSFQMAEHLMTLAYDNGINLFDTAEVYAAGKYVPFSEEEVARGTMSQVPLSLFPGCSQWCLPLCLLYKSLNVLRRYFDGA